MNDVPAAKRDFTKALELDSDLVTIHKALASIELSQRNLDTALAHIEKFIEHFPHLTEGYLKRAKIHMSGGDMIATAKDYEQAVQVNPDNADLQRVHGLFLKGAGQLDKASEVFSKLIEQFPEYFAGHINRAILHENGNQYQAALEDYNRALELNPHSGFGFFHRGCVQIELKNFLAAVADITRAIEIAPQTEAFERRGEAYALLNENALAIEDFGRALAEDPNRNFARYRRGTVYQLTGEQQDNAIADYTYLIDAGVQSLEVFYNRGRLLNQQKQWKRSIADWEQAAKIDVNSLLVINDLAWILATAPDESVRNPQRAIELATRACELTEWELGGSLDTLASAYAASGNFAQAVKWQEMALQKDDTKHNNAEIKARLVLFKENKAFAQE